MPSGVVGVMAEPCRGRAACASVAALNRVRVGDTDAVAALAGRATEQASLRAALDDARAGSGRLVLVSGPAGIGKTALADAAVGMARDRGMATARGRAIDDPGAPPLWPWTRMLRGWTEGQALQVADAAEPHARFRLLETIADVVQAQAGANGLLIVLEDLHWADRLSALALRHLAGELDEQRLAVVATYRDTPGGPFGDVLPDLLRGSAVRTIRLAGLSRAEIAAWLPALVGRVDDPLAGALHERTAGNPLLVRLVAEHTARGEEPAERPDVRRLVVARLAGFTPAARELLDLAAVLGERVPLDALAALTARESRETLDLLAPALAEGVLRRTPDGVRFEHALVRDAVYAEIEPSARREAHRRCAGALADLGGQPALVAAHWQRAGVLDDCRDWAERADDEARAATAYDDAARFARLALDSSVGADRAERSRLLLRLAEALTLADRVVDALDACTEAAELADAAGRPDLLARAALVVQGSGNPRIFAVVPPICERALALLPSDEFALRSRLLAQIAVAMAEREGGAHPAELASAALAAAERSGDPAAELEAIAARHLAITGLETVAERLELGRRAIALGSSGERPIGALWGHLWRADSSFQLGNLAEMDREIDAVGHIARTRGSHIARWHELRMHAARSAQDGDFAAAREGNEQARDLGRRLGEFTLFGVTYAFSVQLAVTRGDPEEVPAGWEDLVSHGPPWPLVQLTFPTVHALQGRGELARSEFERFRDTPRTLQKGVRWFGTMIQLWHAAVLLADAEVAAEVYAQLRDVGHYYTSDGSGVVFGFGSGSRLLGDLARISGRYDVAAAHYRDATAMNLRVNARPHVALSRLGHAQALLALGVSHDPETDASVEQLRDLAAAEFERLDMPGHLATARALRTEQSSPLTPRENEVAALVAQSFSNREIAAQLFLSERTVESHIRSILAKLSFTRRTEIVTWVTLRQR